MRSNSFTDLCKYCKYSVNIDVARQTFCKYYGIKKQGDVCKRYSFDPFKYRVRRKRNNTALKYKQEDFEIT